MPVYTPVRRLPSLFITTSQTPYFFDDADDDEANYGSSRAAVSTSTERDTSAPTQLKRNRSSSGVNAHIRRLIVDTFMTYGRFSHSFRVLTFFPGYMERFHKAYSTIVRNPSGHCHDHGAITLAAAQHSCQYLVSLLRLEFLQAGGDPTWINGIDHAPGKLRRLVTLNTILAHQPWRLTPAHIGALVRADADEDTFPSMANTNSANGNNSPASENWTMGEIVHAIVIMATYHGLASFALSCGLVPELDTLGGTEELDDIIIPTATENDNTDLTTQEADTNDYAHTGEVLQDYDEGVEGLGVSLAPNEQQELESHTVELLSRLQIAQDDEPESNQGETTDETIEDDTEDKPPSIMDAFERCAAVETFKSTDPLMASDDEHAMSASNTASSLPPPSPTGTGSTLTYMSMCSIRLNPVIDDMSRFLHPPTELRHVDFDVKSDEYSVFRLQDYCWEDHGVELVDQFLRGVGDLLDEEFKEALTITDFSFSTQAALLDTWPLRQAIWYYVLRLAGLSHDDYDYAQVNRFLNRRLKQYVKKVACYPEELDARDFVHFGFVLRAEEKCHVNLLVSVARKQAELVYGLYNVMRWSDKGR
ncbi:Sestrin [Syncephalis fuscata]|nr:Sestrin [Syncephalis fuscata]